MKKIIIILLVSFNISFSQFNSINEALKYYPLNTGNYWQFEIGKSFLGDHSFTKIGYASFEIVGDTILENGEKYFNRTSKGMEINMIKFLTTQFLRIDSTNGIVYGNSGSGDDFIVDSLLAAKNDTVQYFMIYDISTKNILGIETETKTYNTSWISSYDFYSWNISKNFGLTYSYYGDASQMSEYQYKLVYAKIGKKKYGTLVNVKYTKDTPQKYELLQNYPNPFNSGTLIKYSIPVKGLVQLKIYDISGREVANLVNKKQTVGNYEIEFNASNLPSGVYFYRLQSGSFTKTKKLILLK